MNKESYGLIPNVAFAFGSKYHLNKDEFMVYVHLQFTKQIGLTNTTITNVEMLIEDLGWETSTKPRDKKRVVNALEGLQEKGYIKIEFKKDTKSTILNSNLTIYHSFKELQKEVVEVSAKWKPNPLKFTGYTEIYGEEYNLAEGDGYKMMVITYVTWRTNPELKYEYKICGKEWESVLGVSDKTARKIITDCEPFLDKISGIHYKDEQGQIKQEANSYELKTRQEKTALKSKVEEVEKENRNLSFLEKQREACTDIRITLDNEIFMQIFDKKTPLKFEGYKAWKETDCEIAKEAGRKCIELARNSKKNPEGGNLVMDRLEKEYAEHLEHQAKQDAFRKLMEAQHVEEEFVSSFKPKKQEEDFFFDD